MYLPGRACAYHLLHTLRNLCAPSMHIFVVSLYPIHKLFSYNKYCHLIGWTKPLSLWKLCRKISCLQLGLLLNNSVANSIVGLFCGVQFRYFIQVYILPAILEYKGYYTWKMQALPHAIIALSLATFGEWSIQAWETATGNVYITYCYSYATLILVHSKRATNSLSVLVGHRQCSHITV